MSSLDDIKTEIEESLVQPIVDRIKSKRGDKDVKYFAEILKTPWRMQFSGAYNTIFYHLEDASAWERLAIRGNKYTDRLHTPKTVLEVRGFYMKDYLNEIGFSKKESVNIFCEISKAARFNPTFQYPRGNI